MDVMGRFVAILLDRYDAVQLVQMATTIANSYYGGHLTIIKTATTWTAAFGDPTGKALIGTRGFETFEEAL